MTEHWCKEHQTVWFKKGNMKGFAHPIIDTEGSQLYDNEGKPLWCNEPKEKEVNTVKPSQKAEMSKDDWAEKDQRTRKSIERQKSLELAVNLCIAKLINKEEIPKYTKSFEKYLEKGGESALVKEAKKLGAVEVEE